MPARRQNTVADSVEADKFLDAAVSQSAAADANDVLYSLKSSADYDPEPKLAQIRAKLFALNFVDDEFNPDSLKLLQKLTLRVPGGRYLVQPGTSEFFGHLTMAHPELWSQQIATFLHELGD